MPRSLRLERDFRFERRGFGLDEGADGQIAGAGGGLCAPLAHQQHAGLDVATREAGQVRHHLAAILRWQVEGALADVADRMPVLHARRKHFAQSPFAASSPCWRNSMQNAQNRSPSNRNLTNAPLASRANAEALQKVDLTQISILLVAVGVVDELPVQLLGLLGIELLTALRTLELCLHFDAHILSGAIARLGSGGDLHGLGHGLRS